MSGASVTVDRVAGLQARILDAVRNTSPDSTMPAGQQDRLLAGLCADTCQLLGDWLESGWFDQSRAADETPLTAALASPEQFARLLGPAFGDALDRLARCGLEVNRAQLEQARDGVARLARRHLRIKTKDLYEIAQWRVRELSREVCRAASQMKKNPTAFRSRAQRALKKVAAFLPSVALSLAVTTLGVGPHQLDQNVSEWAHDAAQVVMVYHLADLAQPGIRISPPAPGPRIG